MAAATSRTMAIVATVATVLNLATAVAPVSAVPIDTSHATPKRADLPVGAGGCIGKTHN